jgi:saccharopine dehydrogenase (NAD+, L-lysine forming)
MKIGILRETKDPPDRRVAFSPAQISAFTKEHGDVDFLVQPSKIRCFSDDDYISEGIELKEDLGECEILFGVKEIEIDKLLQGKTCVFFSHTAKKQPYNRKLLQSVVERKMTLIDYEYLTDTNNIRLVAFGRWAGVVGAYNGLRAYGERYRIYKLKPAHECRDMKEMIRELDNVKLSAIKILITGGGRVAHGAMETMTPLGFKQVGAEEFLSVESREAVVCRIDPWDYVKRTDGKEFDLDHFFRNPAMFESTFKPYTRVTDLFIPCHFWDPASPVFMTPSDMREPEFHMRVIADVSCDIREPIPSTLRASTIADPFYGYDPQTERETGPLDLNGITVMAVDNLPGELPRDASVDFGNMLMEKVLPSVIHGDKEGIIERATIVRNGDLTERFIYLEDYLKGRDQNS